MIYKIWTYHEFSRQRWFVNDSSGLGVSINAWYSSSEQTDQGQSPLALVEISTDDMEEWVAEETYAPLVDQLQTATDQKDREEISLDFPGSPSLESPEKYLKWTLPDATTFRKDLFEVKLMTGLLGRGVVEKFSCLDDSFVWEGASWEDEIPARNQLNNHYQLIADIILFITDNGLSSVDGYLFDKHQMLIEDDVAVFRWPIEEVL